MSTILSDELLRQLIAVGDVDVLVGLPTLNHADTVTAVVRAVHLAFHRELAREKAVLVNVDGGSSDGTPDVVRNASLVERETFLASQSLRTRHRISAPYHGIPGKASALRTLFAAADLLNARSVVILDADVVSMTPEAIAALVQPVLAGTAQFVSPAYARHPLDGPLVTQVVRPLFRAAYGLPLREPLAGELACSADFAASCLERPEWESETLRAGIDLWLATVAAAGRFRAAEVRLPTRRLAPRPRPGVATVVPQILDALFACLRTDETTWTKSDDTIELPVLGRVQPIPPETGPTDHLEFEAHFREGVAALEPIFVRALRPATLEGLKAAATTLSLPDPLWAAVVCELAAAYREAEVSREHLVQAAVPLYLGRVASFATANAGAPVESVEQKLEELCLRFERFKPELVALWTAAVR